MPAPLVAAVLHVESDGRSRAVSRAGAIGCMQLMPGTLAQMRARLALGDDPFDVHDNMLAGTAYLRQLNDRYGWPGALAAYNAGPGRYELYRSAGIPLPLETRAYLARLGVVRSNTGDADAFQPNVERRVEWTQAPLFVVGADVRSASTMVPTEREKGTNQPREISRADVAPTTPGLFVGSRAEDPGTSSRGVFVGTTR